jgi:hypothetical protein
VQETPALESALRRPPHCCPLAASSLRREVPGDDSSGTGPKARNRLEPGTSGAEGRPRSRPPGVCGRGASESRPASRDQRGFRGACGWAQSALFWGRRATSARQSSPVGLDGYRLREGGLPPPPSLRSRNCGAACWAGRASGPGRQERLTHRLGVGGQGASEGDWSCMLVWASNGTALLYRWKRRQRHCLKSRLPVW